MAQNSNYVSEAKQHTGKETFDNVKGVNTISADKSRAAWFWTALTLVSGTAAAGVINAIVNGETVTAEQATGGLSDLAQGDTNILMFAAGAAVLLTMLAAYQAYKNFGESNAASTSMKSISEFHVAGTPRI